MVATGAHRAEFPMAAAHTIIHPGGVIHPITIRDGIIRDVHPAIRGTMGIPPILITLGSIIQALAILTGIILMPIGVEAILAVDAVVELVEVEELDPQVLAVAPEDVINNFLIN